MKTNERYLDALAYMNTTMKADNKAGNQWTYCNVTSKKINKGFESKRKPGNPKAFKTNCVDGVQDALKLAGVPSSALAWYGGKGGVVWCNKNAEAEARKYFDIIKKNKTVLQMYNDMELCDGDIFVGFVSMSHTCSYYKGKKSFDSGHSFCIPKSGEGAKFQKWIGGLTCKNNKVCYIFRLKDRAYYRVQCGAYSTDAAYNEMAQFLRDRNIPFVTINEDGMKKIQLGHFAGKTNAERYGAQLLEKYKLPNFVKEIP